MRQSAWRGIADILRRRLADGDFGPGGMLPGQVALAQSLGVSRHAVRRALALLEEEGLVTGTQGRSAEVVPPRLTYRLGPQTRFGQIGAAAGLVARSQVLAVRQRKRPVQIARMLDVPPGAPMVSITMLRLLGDRPVCLGVHHFDPRRLPGIADALCRGEGVTAALKACGCETYRRESTHVEARRPSAFEAVTLGLSPGQPVLFTTGRNVDADGRPVEVTQTVFRADCVTFLV